MEDPSSAWSASATAERLIGTPLSTAFNHRGNIEEGQSARSLKLRRGPCRNDPERFPSLRHSIAPVPARTAATRRRLVSHRRRPGIARRTTCRRLAHRRETYALSVTATKRCRPSRLKQRPCGPNAPSRIACGIGLLVEGSRTVIQHHTVVVVTAHRDPAIVGTDCVTSGHFRYRWSSTSLLVTLGESFSSSCLVTVCCRCRRAPRSAPGRFYDRELSSVRAAVRRTPVPIFEQRRLSAFVRSSSDGSRCTVTLP